METVNENKTVCFKLHELKISTFEFQTLMNVVLKIYAVRTVTVGTILDRTHARVSKASLDLTAL